MKNPYVFLELQLGGKRIGRVVIELFADLVPRTAENFRGLCTGEYGDALENRKPLSYVGCKVLKIVPGQYIQCGDFTHNNGTGGESIYGGRFSSENYTLWHAHAGVVSMIPDDRRRNGSQFVITLKKASHLNRQNVVCGQVRNGMDILRAIERIPVDESDRPKIPIFVIGAGQTSRNARSKPGEKSHSAASEGKALLKMLLTENLDGHVAASKKQEEKTEDDVTVMIDSPEEPSVPADSVYKEPNERLSSLMTVLDKCRDLNEMAVRKTITPLRRRIHFCFNVQTEEERNNPNGHSDKQMPMGTILPDKPIWSRDERWYLAEPAMTSEARQQREEEKKKHASFAWDVYNARSVFQKYDKEYVLMVKDV